MPRVKSQNKPSSYYPLAIKRFKTSLRILSNSRKLKLIKPNRIRIVRCDRRLSSFGSMFVKISGNARRCCHKMKDNKYVNILKLLDEIIPREYFGTIKNKKLFYKMVKLILTHSISECVYKRDLVRRYDLKAIPWLGAIIKDDMQSKILGRAYLFEGQRWLLERIVKPAIVRFYSIVKSGQQRYQQKLVPKGTWQRFQAKAINLLLQKDYIQLVPNDGTVRLRAILQIRAKNGFDDFDSFRPIVKLLPEPKQLIKRQKEFVKLVEEAARKMCKTMGNLYNGWGEYAMKTKGSKLYAVKLDVQDAFGNINIELLCQLLEV